MSDESERFFRRAQEWRDIAARVPLSEWSDRLIELAHDLEVEAGRIAAEQAPTNYRHSYASNATVRLSPEQHKQLERVRDMLWLPRSRNTRHADQRHAA